MTGGPGCSSELALFYENGPYLAPPAKNVTNLQLNPNSWNSFANLLYIDQPVGTGFSYADVNADYVHNETQVAFDLYWFLIEFYALHPQYSKLPLYIFGESYAGVSYRAKADRVA